MRAFAGVSIDAFVSENRQCLKKGSAEEEEITSFSGQQKSRLDSRTQSLNAVGWS